jgi:hypothetical protein
MRVKLLLGVNVLYPLVLHWFLSNCVISYFRSSSSDYVDVPSVIPCFDWKHSGYFDSFFPISLQIMSVIPPYRGPMRDNTYKSMVAVGTPMHNVIVAGNCDMWLVLYYVWNLLWFVLLLYKLHDYLAACYTMVPDYTAWYCIGHVSGCTVAAHYCTNVARYYTFVAWCCMGLELEWTVVLLAQSSFMLVPYMHLMFFPTSAP